MMHTRGILILISLVNLNLYSAGNPPRWIQGKITNNTTQDIEVKVKYTLNCDKVPASEKTKCSATSGSVLLLRINPRQTVSLSDINAIVSKFPQSSEHGQFKNALHIIFPAEPGTKTYAPLTLAIADSDLEKLPKNFYVTLTNGKMQLQVR